MRLDLQARAATAVSVAVDGGFRGYILGRGTTGAELFAWAWVATALLRSYLFLHM